MTQPQPGWYPDPADPARQRYWAGDAWTADTRNTGAPDSQPASPAVPSSQTDPYARYAQGATQTYQPSSYQALPAYTPAAHPQHTPQYTGAAPTTADGVPLSGWWWRVLATIIDSLVLGVIGAIYMPLIPNLRSGAVAWEQDFANWLSQGSTDPTTIPFPFDPSYHLTNAYITFTVVSLIVTCVYVIVMLSLAGATLGMLACGLRVVPVDKGQAPRRLPLVPVLLRLVFYTLIPQGLSLIGLTTVLHSTSWTSMNSSPLSTIALVYMLINVLWPLWDKKRQCIHDKAARTQVIRPIR